MFFIIQKEKNESLDIDNIILRNLIKKEKYVHEYITMCLNDFFEIDKNGIKKGLKSKESFSKKMQEAIPLGTITFVTTYFQIFYGIERQNPIEIPDCLRKEEFLKRKYSIIKQNEIPNTGYYFLKDVSELKKFSYCGDMDFFHKQNRYILNKEHLYELSDVVSILAEYRIIVLDNEIYSINYYDGDCTLFPDINLIKKAIRIWSLQIDCPNSYTMDVAINTNGTFILECHILFSCGIYNVINGTNLLYGYKDAKDYIIKYNTPIKPWNGKIL